MYRVTSNLTNDDMQYFARRREFMMNQVQNRMSSQTRIQNLRDDPLAAAHSTRYQSYLTRLNRYADNIQYTQDNYHVAESYMKQAVDMLQRIREIGVQGANGTYTKSDMQKMAGEVNELLGEFVKVANGRNGDGATLFSGQETQGEPFRAVYGNVAGAPGQVITGVEYTGDIGKRQTEIADGSYIDMNFPGNEVFWAENQQIFATRDATSYQVPENSSFFIDGVQISVSAGDNIQAVISKINDSAAAVKARLDPVQNSLVLETTSPHQLWIQGGTGSPVLQDLGVVSTVDNTPPANAAPTADVFGGSLFDMIVRLRDDLYAGKQVDVGGRALRGIDSGLDNLLSSLGSLGAKDARLQVTYKRNQTEIPQITELNSKAVDVDMTKAITDLKMLEYTHKAALSTSARILQPTLLDFLR